MGLVLDSRLTFEAHVAAICKACNYHIWALRHVRRCLPTEVAHTLACNIVSAKLDYCNSVLYGVSVSQLNKLQRVQNSLARVVLQQPKRAHSKPLLQHLHRLPVPLRIQYKLAVQTFKTKQTCQPSYLYNLLSSRLPITTMSLQSSSCQLLELHCTRTVYGSCAFSVATPNLWNTTS